MPMLALRGLSPALMARLSAYADRVGLGREAAAVALLDQALEAHQRRVDGGKARAAQPDAQDARRKGGATTRARHTTTAPSDPNARA